MSSVSASSTPSTTGASSSFGSRPPVNNGGSTAKVADDLRNAKFTTAFRGYDPAEVRAFLQRMAMRVEAELSAVDRVTITPIASDAELVLDEAAYLAAAAASALDSSTAASPVETADGVLLAARSEYESILASARNEANAIVVKANDDAARIILRARAESRGKPSADSSAVVEAAYAQAASDPELAREQARLMITEARAVRERILTDLNKRRRVAHVQLEQLRVAREKLTETLREARRIVDDSARDLSTAEVEARLAADAAGRRISAEALPSIGELEVELWGGRHMPSTRTFASASTPVSDADDSFETPTPASVTTPMSTAQGEVPAASPDVAPIQASASVTEAVAEAVVEGVVEGSAVKDSGTEAVVETQLAHAASVDQLNGPSSAVMPTTLAEIAVAAPVALVVVEDSPLELASETPASAEPAKTGLVLSVPMLPTAGAQAAETAPAMTSESIQRVPTNMVASGADLGVQALSGRVVAIEGVTPVGTLPVGGDLDSRDRTERSENAGSLLAVDLVAVDLAAVDLEVTSEVPQPTSVQTVSDQPVSDQPVFQQPMSEQPEAEDSVPVQLEEIQRAAPQDSAAPEVIKKRAANVDDLFARLRADRERAAVEARSLLGVKDSDERGENEAVNAEVLDLRPTDESGGGGNNSRRSKGTSGTPKPARNPGSSRDEVSGGASVQAGTVVVLDRADTEEHVTAIVLDLRPSNPPIDLRTTGTERSSSEAEHTVSEADDSMDFVVGPLHSSLIRTVKRRLHDEQSSILAMLRSYRGALDVDRLLGSAQDHQLRLTNEIQPIFVDAFRVGAEKSGSQMSEREINELLREHIESVAASVTATIRSEVSSIVASQGGNDSRALGESLTSTYRTWTTERIGAVVTGAVVETYRLGTAA
jgi:DivIVA domain-containing protein